MNATNNDRKANTAERTAELYRIQNETSKIVAKLCEMSWEDPQPEGIDELLDTCEEIFARTNELLAI